MVRPIGIDNFFTDAKGLHMMKTLKKQKIQEIAMKKPL